MKPRTRKHGFTLVEVLLAVTILAIVLASISTAIDASISSYRANDDIASVTQITRMVMSRMMREVRTAVDIDSTATYLVITPPDNAQGITQIRYDYIDSVLYRSQIVGGQTLTQVLIGNEDDVAIGLFSIVREDDLEGNPISVTVRMGMSVGKQEMSMTSSACIRKRQLY